MASKLHHWCTSYGHFADFDQTAGFMSCIKFIITKALAMP